MSSAITADELVPVWFGTRGDAKGIYRAHLNIETGKLSKADLAYEIKNCGFLCLSRDASRLYSLGAMPPSTDDNLAAFKIDTSGELTVINTQNSEGGRPTHLSLSRDQGTLFVAHYSAGRVVSLPITAEGQIGPPASNIQHSGSSVNRDRQDRAHPHWIGATPDNRFVLVPDLGMDKIVIYSFDANSHSLTPHGHAAVQPGSGPRHLAFHPSEPIVFLMNELSLTVTTFRYDGERGTLTEIDTAEALPASEKKEIVTTGSEISAHPNGRFVYAGIRGHDVIAVFEYVDGRLQFIEREPIRGSWPRHFALDPTGRWLLAAGAESSTISVFSVDHETGRLTFTRQIIHVPECICVAFSPMAE